MRGAYMIHDLNVGESVYTNQTTGETLKFSQGEITFEKDGQTRYLEYNPEGLRSVADANNTGTSGNSSFHLVGAKTGSVQYLQSSAGNGIQQRLEFEDIKARILVGDSGEFEVMHYINKDFAPVSAAEFKTKHATGYTLQMVHRIETPRDGIARDLLLTPNGTGIVKVANKNDEYYNIRAATFLNASSRVLKTNIVETEIKALEALDTLTVVDYDLKKDIADGVENRQTGFIAEDSRIISDKEGKSIDSYKLATLTAKAVQELDAENKYLKQELQEIKQHLGLA